MENDTGSTWKTERAVKKTILVTNFNDAQCPTITGKQVFLVLQRGQYGKPKLLYSLCHTIGGRMTSLKKIILASSKNTAFEFGLTGNQPQCN